LHNRFFCPVPFLCNDACCPEKFLIFLAPVGSVGSLLLPLCRQHAVSLALVGCRFLACFTFPSFHLLRPSRARCIAVVFLRGTCFAPVFFRFPLSSNFFSFMALVISKFYSRSTASIPFSPRALNHGRSLKDSAVATSDVSLYPDLGSGVRDSWLRVSTDCRQAGNRRRLGRTLSSEEECAARSLLAVRMEM